MFWGLALTAVNTFYQTCYCVPYGVNVPSAVYTAERTVPRQLDSRHRFQPPRIQELAVGRHGNVMRMRADRETLTLDECQHA